MKLRLLRSAAALVAATTVSSFAASSAAPAAQPLESVDIGRWYISPGIGYWNLEGDEGLEDAFYLTLRLGYDWSEWWSFELSAVFAPKMDENLKDGEDGHYWRDNPDDPATYRRHDKQWSYSKGDKYFGDTWGLMLYGDAMFHFSSWDRIDPYLIFGAGLTTYGEDVMDETVSFSMRAGGGLMYHVDDSWTLRLDTRVDLAGYNTEFNHTVDVGFLYRFGADRIKDDPVVAADPRSLDSDGDGLSDWDEINVYHTDPNNPDTDGDGLRDGEEVLKYKTNPLDPDTDHDGLRDGEEVKRYKTNPLNPDTDGDGLLDGDEVKTYLTNPLDPDTDRDGLKDGEEVKKTKTDPLNPDTDGDGLLDGDEVRGKHSFAGKPLVTDPLNPDSDFDMLSDGYEVLQSHTNPLDPDTDKGGVRDGHEVIYDHTNPLDPADDILFFELKINFDTDKDVIKPEFFAQLDKVADVMLRNPGSTAVVEGHADRRATSKRNYNIRLSERRAKAVARYFEGKGISADRLKAVGYGFDHPKAANDPKSGNLANRRVEVYIDGVRPGKVNYVNPGN
ncbi:MAG: OmpA family protein [Kiritimatiellae bacterium]|nr:OmpA family protein [Kiritimatiellia bacterium]